MPIMLRTQRMVRKFERLYVGLISNGSSLLTTIDLIKQAAQINEQPANVSKTNYLIFFISFPSMKINAIEPNQVIKIKMEGMLAKIAAGAETYPMRNISEIRMFGIRYKTYPPFFLPYILIPPQIFIANKIIAISMIATKIPANPLGR